MSVESAPPLAATPAFEHVHHVRFAEVDQAGIVFFSRAFEYAHVAFEALLCDAGMPLAEIFTTQDWVMPLVHVDADYRVPMRLGDELRIGVSVERLGTSSATFRFALRSGPPEQERLHVIVRHVHACVDKLSGRSRPLDPRLRRALQPYVSGLPRQSERSGRTAPSGDVA